MESWARVTFINIIYRHMDTEKNVFFFSFFASLSVFRVCAFWEAMNCPCVHQWRMHYRSIVSIYSIYLYCVSAIARSAVIRKPLSLFCTMWMVEYGGIYQLSDKTRTPDHHHHCLRASVNSYTLRAMWKIQPGKELKKKKTMELTEHASNIFEIYLLLYKQLFDCGLMWVAWPAWLLELNRSQQTIISNQLPDSIVVHSGIRVCSSI